MEASAPWPLIASGRRAAGRYDYWPLRRWGFDDARLDTLFPAMPVAWRGTLQQYAGRLHRLHAGKAEGVIYDYVHVDEGAPVLVRMHRKRLAGYRAMGYAVTSDPGAAEPLIPQDPRAG